MNGQEVNFSKLRSEYTHYRNWYAYQERYDITWVAAVHKYFVTDTEHDYKIHCVIGQYPSLFEAMVEAKTHSDKSELSGKKLREFLEDLAQKVSFELDKPLIGHFADKAKLHAILFILGEDK